MGTKISMSDRKDREVLMTKKIAMIVQSYYDKDPRVRRDAEALADRGIQVDVIALRHNGNRVIDYLNNVKIYQLPIRKKRGGIFRYLFEYLLFFTLGSAWLTVLFIKNRYRICHVHNMPDFLVFSTIIPKLFGAKVILDIHDPMPELFSIKFHLKEIFIKMIKFEERLSTRFAHHVITVNEFVKKKLIARGCKDDKITIIMNTPDKKLFCRQLYQQAPALSQNEFVLLFAGTVTERNGLAIVIETLPLLVDKIPQIQLRIIGEGNYLQVLKALVQKLGMEKYVSFNKPVPLQQIPMEILRADAVIWFPVQNDFTNLCISVKMLEALIMGTPVITTRTQCQDYYFDDKEVIFVDKVEKKNIAAAIYDLYCNKNRQDEFLVNSAKIANKFNWDNEKQRYFQLIENLLNHKN